ncbi:MAG: VCBS repeat-containing protein [Acidobacteria bacterium]|nr:VCBS repeat-containing protein [Acidobacteriota bacterium]
MICRLMVTVALGALPFLSGMYTAKGRKPFPTGDEQGNDPRLSQFQVIHQGFDDFSKGTLSGAGANIYVSRRGRIQLVQRLDLNNDGHIDLLIANGHGHTEKEDLFIYLNGHGDYDVRRRWALPADGASDVAVADFNHDGRNDIVVSNRSDGVTRRLQAFIYYSSPDGYQVRDRVELDAFGATAVCVADFNADGWLDLAFACENEKDGRVTSTVYWNSAAGFQRKRRQDFTDLRLQAIVAVDWDGDGVTDLLGLTAKERIIFRGTSEGLREIERHPGGGLQLAVGDFDGNGRTDCAVLTDEAIWLYTDGDWARPVCSVSGLRHATAFAAGDLDHDGYQDLAIAVGGEQGCEFAESMIVWNGPGGLDRRERTRLPTVSASCVEVADLDLDEYPEVIFGNHHAEGDLSIPSFVYWNERGDFHLARRSMLPTRGVVKVRAADVNGDGVPDLLFANTEGGRRAGLNPNYIYWGDGSRNYGPERATEIPSYYSTGSFQADLDDDGWPDIGFNEGRFSISKPDTLHGVYLYWGSARGFDTEARTILAMQEAEGGIRVADLDRDGYLDLIAGGAVPEGRSGGGFAIFWGAASGFSTRRRSFFDTGTMSRAPLVADLDGDGFLDLAAAPYAATGLFIYWGSAAGYSADARISKLLTDREVSHPEAADLDRDGLLDLVIPTRRFQGRTETDTYVYYRTSEGFTERRRIALPSMAAYDPSIADLDRDSWLDLVIPNYSGSQAGKRSLPVYIYWGNRTGFDRSRRSELPADSASGTMVADFDGDSWLDLFVACHRKDGSRDKPGHPHNHRAFSFIYWNGPDGFRSDSRTALPSSGPHVQLGADPGSIATREFFEDYTSPVFHAPRDATVPCLMDWECETPAGTAIEAQFRSAATREETLSAAWLGPGGPGTWFLKAGANLRELRGSWCQYRFRLHSRDGARSPYLTRVSLRFAARVQSVSLPGLSLLSIFRLPPRPGIMCYTRWIERGFKEHGKDPMIGSGFSGLIRIPGTFGDRPWVHLSRWR